MIIDKKFIINFNKEKNRKLYREVFNTYIKDGKNCRICNDVIYYYDSTFKLSKGVLIPHCKSYLTTKCVDKVYNLSVCEDCLTNKYPEYQNKNKSRVFNNLNYITEYAFDIDIDVAQKWRNEKYTHTLENMISRYGVVDGQKKWDTYCEKQANSNSFEYKKEKYGWNKEQYDEYNKSRSVTIENLIARHGEEKGLEMWDSYCEKQRYSTSLEYFIKSYGVDEGFLKFRNFNDQRSFYLRYSNISQELFKRLDKEFNYKSYYGINNGEIEYVYITDDNLTRSYFLDYYIEDLNIGIEFNGDMWHANPNIYNEGDVPYNYELKLTAKDIWDKDKKKVDFLNTKLDKLIIIWESDLKKDGMELTVEKLLQEINDFKKEKGLI